MKMVRVMLFLALVFGLIGVSRDVLADGDMNGVSLEVALDFASELRVDESSMVSISENVTSHNDLDYGDSFRNGLKFIEFTVHKKGLVEWPNTSDTFVSAHWWIVDINNKPVSFGNLFLYAHNLEAYQEQIAKGRLSLRLGKMQVGDRIVVETNKSIATYMVRNMIRPLEYEVGKIDEAMRPYAQRVLIFQVCGEPTETEPDNLKVPRDVVVAELIRVDRK